jgi:uncharacterized repeat protein (TIGR01451 family)
MSSIANFARRGRRSFATVSVTALIASTAVVFSLGVTPAAAADTVPPPAHFFTVIDSGGANDINSEQNDMTQMGRDDSNPSLYDLFWSWDTTDFTAQKGNACALFDSNGNGNIDFAVCAEVENVPNGNTSVVEQTAISPLAVTCSDAKNDRCTNPSAPIDLTGGKVTTGDLFNFDPSPPANLVTNTDPFPNLLPDQTWPNDTSIQVKILKSFLPSGATLVNVCSYPSLGNTGNNNPFDCVVTPGGGFLSIVKHTAGGDDTFGYTIDAPSNVPTQLTRSITTVAGVGTADAAALIVGSDTSVTEDSATGWTLTGASCSLEGGGTTGTYSAADRKVTGITIESGKITTCTFDNTKPGQIIVKKVTNPASATDTFAFTGSAGVGTITDLGNNETWTSGPLGPGTYTVGEAAKTGWSLTGLTCSDANSTGDVATRTATYRLEAGETVTCTFSNTQLGTIIVKKVSDPPGGTGFTFTGDAAGTIDDGGTITVSNLMPGTYTSTETDPTGYSLDSIVCDDAQSATPSTDNLTTRTATFKLDAGETVTCTFSNTKLATLIVKKVTVPSSSTETFAFTGDVAGSIGNGQTLTVSNVAPGTYTSTEAAKAGWTLTGLVCDDANSTGDLATRTATFHAEAGETVTCTFTNTHKVALSITKAINANGDNVPAAGFVFSVSCTDGTNASVTFTEAGTKSVDGIIEGSSCDVTETPVTGWTVTPSTKQNVTVGPDGAAVSFTNTRDVGKITVTKATSGAVAGASTVFTFDVVCPSLPAFNQTLTIDTASASSAMSTDIPTGIVCTVTERSTTGWQQTTPASGGVDVTVPGTAAFTNTRVTGPLQLSKSVTPTTGSYTAGAPGNTLTYTLTLKPTGLLDHTNVVVTDYIPGYDPSDVDSTGKQKSGLTVYVANSATCSTGCTATYDASKHLLTWNVGSVAHDSTGVLLGFKVTIVKPASTVQSGIPASVIDNIGFVESLQQSKTPSNKVQVPVTAVLGVKVVRKPVQVLPFTGGKVPLQPLALVAMVMIGAGILMTSTRRCRAD